MEPISTPFFVTLQDRGQIRIEGADRLTFLQGLITQDVLTLPLNTLRYGCLLTPQGKFLHDFFMYRTDDALFLDVEGGHRTEDMMTRLMRYKLRAHISLSCDPTVSVYAVINAPVGLSDPRHPGMGSRSWVKPDLPERPFAQWDDRRIWLNIPDGSRDMIPEKSILLECGIDKLNGIDFAKGCYMGQELTARTHYRALIKKHLYPVQWHGATPPPFTDISLNGETIGDMRSSCGHIGLAMIRDDAVERLHDPHNPVRLLG
ncbi:MAG: folate-binding protein YgfZ [Alphaproteobacteria bacterium]|nr:folate-binding protein YgfZ [Alphaproteobacteria bacterium]